jgi:hypothetical protein
VFVKQVERILTDSNACCEIAPDVLDAAQMLIEALRKDFEVILT